jgi:uncharacterized membrane protein
LAPFTLPIRNATAIELVAYYLVINIAVAVLSTFRPWKVLNQIAFLMTVVVGGAYAFYQGKASERDMLAVLVLAHSAVFIWLSFRYSQLLAREDLTQFKLKPILDVALITTIFGLIVALILQLFYNYILSKIEALTSDMEDSSITLLDMVIKYNLKYKK